MDRVYKAGAQGVAPLAAENASGPYPTAGVPGVTAPTKPGPFWFHMIMEELLSIISFVGTAFDKNTLTQVRDALFLLFDSQGIEPGGRLTLTTGVAVTSADVAGVATVYYTPHRHDRIKLYDGVRWKWYTFAEMSQALNDTTKSPAAVIANKNYDYFTWDDAGTLRTTRGPKWDDGAVAGSDIARGTGAASTELEFFNGRWVNKIAITNGPAARRGLFVGTIRSDGSSQANDSKTNRHVWNAYHRAERSAGRLTPTDSWTYTTNTYREAEGGTANRFNFVRGLNEDAVNASVIAMPSNTTVSSAWTAIGLDSTTVQSCLAGETGLQANITSQLSAFYDDIPGLGAHFLSWLEKSAAIGTTTWTGDSGSDGRQAGIIGRVLA